MQEATQKLNPVPRWRPTRAEMLSGSVKERPIHVGGALLFALTLNSTQYSAQFMLYFQYFYLFFFLQLRCLGVNVPRCFCEELPKTSWLQGTVDPSESDTLALFE